MQLLSVSTPANHILFDSPPLTPYKNLMPVSYTDAGGGELLRVGLTSLTARGTVLIITLIGNGFGGHFVSKKLSGDFAFGNCLKKMWYIWLLHMGAQKHPCATLHGISSSNRLTGLPGWYSDFRPYESRICLIRWAPTGLDVCRIIFGGGRLLYFSPMK